MSRTKRIKCRPLLHIAILFAIILLGAWLRYDTLSSGHDSAQSISLFSHEGTAVSLYKGYGFRIYPTQETPGHKAFDPKPYFTQPDLSAEEIEKLPQFVFNPGLPVALALTYRLFGPDPKYYRIFQFSLSLLHILLIYYIAMTLFGAPSVALVAAFLQTVFFPEMRFSLYIGREIYTTTAILIFATLTLFMVKHAEAHIRKTLIAAGALGIGIGLCVYMRSTALIFLFCLPIVLMCLLSFRRAAILSIVAISLSALTLAPWLIRNKVVTGQYKMSEESKFFAAWVGLGYQRNSVGSDGTDTFGFSSINIHGRARGKPLDMNYYQGGAGQYEDMAKELFTDYVATQPFTFLKSYAKAVRSNFFNHTEWAYYDFRATNIPNLLKSKSVLGEARADRIVDLWVRLVHIIPWLALAGIIIGFVYQPWTLVITIPMLASLLQISVAMSHYNRYITHILVIEFVFAAYGLYFICRKTVDLLRPRTRAKTVGRV